MLLTSQLAGVLETRLQIAKHNAPLPDCESAQLSGTCQLLSAPYQLTWLAFLALNLNKSQTLFLLLFVFLPVFYLFKFKNNPCIFVLFSQNGHHGYGEQGTQKKAELLSWQSVKNFY